MSEPVTSTKPLDVEQRQDDSRGSAQSAARDARKLLYFIGVDWFFYSHFLDRAIAAKNAGYDVVVLTGISRNDDPLAKHGIKLIGIPFARRSIHPKRFFRNLRDVIRVLKAEKPDIIHQIALKPILIGSLAARWVGIKRVINAVVGLGFAFSSETRPARTAKWFVSLLFHLVLDKHHAKTVFENADDRAYFLEQGWVREEGAVLIRGAGVDIDRFKPVLRETVGEVTDTQPQTGDQETSSTKEPPIVMLLSRMLWDKGIGEFVEAAKQLRQQHGSTYARFVLVGDPDDDNRGAISRDQLQAWQNAGVIEWWGFKPDVQNILAQATISCLPSYREGLPKSLLESLAMGLPCIATDVPGCREAVINAVNGVLVPPRQSEPLAKAIDDLLRNPSLREQYGQASRQMAVEQFSREIVSNETLALYNRVLSETALS
jgi:glycosyltransferase involved in cell wall biosynthesis